MTTGEMVQNNMDGLVRLSSSSLIPILITTFVGAIILRVLIYFSVRRHNWFTKEFEKRVGRFMEAEAITGTPLSFYSVIKRILERTYYEAFEVRSKLKRRKPDQVMSVTDRVFLVKQGTAWMIRDILKQVRNLKYSAQQPKLFNVAKSVFQSNPCFNSLFGIIPMSGINDILNSLPGLFVICGILGTFLGIMKGLPELGGMNLSDVEQTKLVMDQFLNNIAFSMATSIVGILCSVATSVVNTILSPEKLFVELLDRFENSLDVVWNRCDNNELPEANMEFDENRDPLEAIAEASLAQELEKSHRTRELTKLRSPQKGKNAS